MKESYSRQGARNSPSRRTQKNSPPATAEGLIGYWRLDQVEDDGRTFTDLSGNGYHGKASSNPIWTGEIKCPVVD